jgi:hypothetical protein
MEGWRVLKYNFISLEGRGGIQVQEVPVIRVFINHFPTNTGPNYRGTMHKNSPHFQRSHPWTGSFHIKSTQKRGISNPTPSELNDSL